MILLVGNARSGTSWLGKIFDSHPDVVYRHEPDSSLPSQEFPFFLEGEAYEEHETAAAAYLEKLCDLRTIRAVGRRPHFDKNYRSQANKALHVGLVSSLQLLAKVPVLGTMARRANVPDLARKSNETKCVVKSVVSLGRAGLYSRALNEGKLVFLIRHPCGVVASQIRGMKLGKLTYGAPFQTISRSAIGQRYGLTVERLKNLPQEEALAWTWVVMNEQALQGIQGRDNAVTVTHEALCIDALGEAKRLFEFCGLDWSDQTEAFLSPDVSSERAPSYFDLKRESSAEVDKWKKELDGKTIDVVLSILSKSSLSQFFR
ncbi:MAG: sulfotransferase [Pseudomonadota bacterium]